MNLLISARSSMSIVTAVVLLVGASAATGQQSTEQYIPIGSSPGVSGKYSYIGQLAAVDLANRRLTVEDASGEHSIAMNQGTRIWLDRTASRRANTVGSYADCQVGRRVEVMPMHDDPGVAAWIKIEAR